MTKIPDKARQIMSILLSPWMAPSGRMMDPAKDVLIVGGFVRDSLLGVENKDIDIEVYGMDIDSIKFALLANGFKVNSVGKAFGVLKIDNELDISVPRRENKIGVGHKGFDVTPDPDMSIKEAASRRDFTVNSMAMRLDGEIIDPFNGMQDLRDSILRATSEAFNEDPLRVMRAMQFAARFRLGIDMVTERLCRDMAPLKSELPKERIWEEWKKWALKGVKPSLGLKLLIDTGWADPEIQALVDVPQDPEWHPEGWSAFTPSEQEILAVNSCLTSPTQSIGVDDNTTTLRQFLQGAFTKSASRPQSSSTTSTQSSEINSAISGVSAASSTRTLRFDLPTAFSEAVITQSVSLVGNISPVAPRAGKIVRVMLEISQSGMLCIMRSAVNDFKIINTIVEPISIFMMNMLFGGKGSSQMQFHQNTMEKNTSILARFTSLGITASVMNTTSASVNSNVIISFDFGFKSDVDFIHGDFLVVDKDDPLLFYTKITQGDVFIHTCHVVDAAANIADREQLGDHDRLVLIFAALCHDFGKPETTAKIDGRWRARGHCEAGVEPARRFLESIGAPAAVIVEVLPLISDHLVHAGVKDPSDKAIRRLAKRLYPSSIKMLSMVVESDHNGRPPLPKGNPLADWAKRAIELDVVSQPAVPIIRGRDLIQLGMSPGREMGDAIASALEAQLDGAFSNLSEGLQWLRSRPDLLVHPPSSDERDG